MRTSGVTGGTSPALAICARLSMYCRQSRSRPESHGLCSISNTQPSNFDALIAIAESTCGGREAGQRVLPGLQGADDVVETRQFGHVFPSV